MYRESLKNLREQVFATEPEPVKTPKKGLIRARVESTPTKAPSITPYAEWLRTISQVSAEVNSPEKREKRRSGGFAQGFASTVTIGETDRAEKLRETLVQRRGDLPSLYAPKPSNLDEGNSHEARINGTFSGWKGLMDKYEGGGDYDTLFKFSNKEGGAFSDVKITQMTIGELKAFANGRYGKWSKGELGYKATPMGRYQFVGGTLASVARQMGLPDDTVFDQATQDAMFEFHMKQTLAGGKSIDHKIDLVRGQWEGFKHVPRDVLADMIVKYG